MMAAKNPIQFNIYQWHFVGIGEITVGKLGVHLLLRCDKIKSVISGKLSGMALRGFREPPVDACFRRGDLDA
jgi:hypothetical protein